MILLVKYLVFYPDNYQGASGTHHREKKAYSFNKGISYEDSIAFIKNDLDSKVGVATKAYQDGGYTIQSIEVLEAF